MKKNFRLFLMFAAFGIVFGASTSVYSQIKTGGYKAVAFDDEGVVAAANFAVEKKSEEQEVTISLESIQKAESQTVAGINYRLCLNVSSTNSEGVKSDTVTVQVIVFQNLKNEYSLTSWSDEECSGNQ
ncbi:hypothetical protein BH10ACI1_BH10ACI1_29370 [soil metagenome]